MSNRCGRAHGSVPSCALCEVLEHNQERAFAKGHCGALSGAPDLLICDRESGHDGMHRGYVDEHDEVLFWETGIRLRHVEEAQ